MHGAIVDAKLANSGIFTRSTLRLDKPLSRSVVSSARRSKTDASSPKRSEIAFVATEAPKGVNSPNY